ncbi:MAG: hypothetical protein Q9165_007923 [Trypethelium subeluteriae]
MSLNCSPTARDGTLWSFRAESFDDCSIDRGIDCDIDWNVRVTDWREKVADESIV